MIKACHSTTSRRALLAGAPAAALVAGAATSGLAAALANPSGVDPVFAAIAEYKAAVQARSIVLDNVDNEEAYPSERAWDQAQGQASDREQDAINAILESEPTTIAGIAAVLEILGTDLYTDDDMIRLAETLRSLIGEAQSFLRTSGLAACRT
jgi:hypothetical protein